MPTKVARNALDHSTWGTKVALKTECQSGRAKKAAAIYAKSTIVSHLKMRANWRYVEKKSSE